VVREDPADDRVLACALAAKADYIVSKDEHLQKIRNIRELRFSLPKNSWLLSIRLERFQRTNEQNVTFVRRPPPKG